MKYQSLRGMKDILPEETSLWQKIEKTAVQNFERYNYQEIRTPVLEMTELFKRAVGNGTDIVSKEMYSFVDKGERDVTLRPEGTASIARACLQHNLISADKTSKLYYFGPMFRYERPQAGRLREFHQIGIEAFGSDDPALDAETIFLAMQIFKDLGLLLLEVDINSVGCRECRPDHQKLLKEYLSQNLNTLCEQCKIRYEFNPLRVLDCKEQHCKKVIEAAPAITESICESCKTHFGKVLNILASNSIKHKINTRLVRGLDYYTKTTYEIISNVLGAQNAVCGGGRYDNLVEDFGGPSIPAVGFAIGLERLVEVLKEQKPLAPSGVEGLAIYIAPIGEEAKAKAIEYLQKTRDAGISCDMDYQNKKLKSQLKDADRIGARYVLIVGEEELKKNLVILRDMRAATQIELPFEEVLQKIK